MISYEQLAAALSDWRTRQGLPSGANDFLGPSPHLGLPIVGFAPPPEEAAVSASAQMPLQASDEDAAADSVEVASLSAEEYGNSYEEENPFADAADEATVIAGADDSNFGAADFADAAAPDEATMIAAHPVDVYADEAGVSQYDEDSTAPADLASEPAEAMNSEQELYADAESDAAEFESNLDQEPAAMAAPDESTADFERADDGFGGDDMTVVASSAAESYGEAAPLEPAPLDEPPSSQDDDPAFYVAPQADEANAEDVDGDDETNEVNLDEDDEIDISLE